MEDDGKHHLGSCADLVMDWARSGCTLKVNNALGAIEALRHIDSSNVEAFSEASTDVIVVHQFPCHGYLDNGICSTHRAHQINGC